MPPLQVSEILGTLTTSESMFKFIKKYSEAHLRTFGQQKRVLTCMLPLIPFPPRPHPVAHSSPSSTLRCTPSRALSLAP
eukprot:scaffold297251_cov26-Tisochrysis_lutea.AAC.12